MTVQTTEPRKMTAREARKIFTSFAQSLFDGPPCVERDALMAYASGWLFGEAPGDPGCEGPEVEAAVRAALKKAER